nr:MULTISPECIES: hypothetical protein [unclassified Clostridium]
MTRDNTIDGFYIDNDGNIASGTGWLKDEYSGDWYYFSDGEMKSNDTEDGYHVDNSGKMVTGTGWEHVDSWWYYLDDTGKVVTGWLYDQGNWYYLYPQGSMAHNTTIDGYYLDDDGKWVPGENNSNNCQGSSDNNENDDGIKVYTQEEADKYINSYLWGHCIGRKLYFPYEISGLPQKIIYQSSGYMYDYELKENPHPTFNGMDLSGPDFTFDDGTVSSGKTYSYQLVYTDEPSKPQISSGIVFVSPEGGAMEAGEISAEEKAVAEAEVNKAKESIDGESKANNIGGGKRKQGTLTDTEIGNKYNDWSNNLKDNSYTGGRSTEEIQSLAKDPDHAGSNRIVDIEKGMHEAEVGLDLEGNGKLSDIVRDPTGDAEFIENGGNGSKWDVKTFNSDFPPKQGGFTLERSMNTIYESLGKGENVIIDTSKMSEAHKKLLMDELEKKGLMNPNIIKIWP